MDATLDRWREQLATEEIRLHAMEVELSHRRAAVERERNALADELAAIEGIREALQVYAGQASILMNMVNERAAGFARSVAGVSTRSGS